MPPGTLLGSRLGTETGPKPRSWCQWRAAGKEQNRVAAASGACEGTALGLLGVGFWLHLPPVHVSATCRAVLGVGRHSHTHWAAPPPLHTGASLSRPPTWSCFEAEAWYEQLLLPDTCPPPPPGSWRL
ncbi:phosphatidylinositol 3-kinase regulatory subunit gamma [Platysternon megacephalum]|uniref:Phosphatidylinositol 3-kinase regulatory subunit gamma n=1 Tax=Platysternon megacephalum TaxID=55544 RepID=A0A4D9E0Z4_9SAUR|nr:phosphatidylinositol 3-kinase regulatory subunit gamma [Platysternon megacephalum]